MARRQQEKSLQTMEELMASAAGLFEKKGFTATTIAEITKNAGYAKGNFYRYWDSKDEIFLKIMEERLENYRYERRTAIEKASSLDDIMNIIIDFLEAMILDNNWARVFLEFTINASRSVKMRGLLDKSEYRFSNKMFAHMVEPYIETGFSPEKMGALNTALFEGFLIHNILGTDVLSKDDFRQAALTLARASAMGSAT